MNIIQNMLRFRLYEALTEYTVLIYSSATNAINKRVSELIDK